MNEYKKFFPTLLVRTKHFEEFFANNLWSDSI